MKEININNLLSYTEYADKHTSKTQPLSRQRVIQLVNEGRLKSVVIAGKKFIAKDAKIKPSKKKPGRPPLKK